MVSADGSGERAAAAPGGGAARHLERALTQWPEQDLETPATLLGRFLEDTSHTALVED
ncbi:hypothetical protein ABIA39_001189 [Nocardia sp. GAS34]|uniref:hypothetical protein n=1 Tax=unclassified Nocardia TaxID=2637762 RepID=UPI003D21E451